MMTASGTGRARIGDTLMKRQLRSDQGPAVTNTQIAGVARRSASCLAAIAVILFLLSLFPMLRSVETKTGRTQTNPLACAIHLKQQLSTAILASLPTLHLRREQSYR